MTDSPAVPGRRSTDDPTGLRTDFAAGLAVLVAIGRQAGVDALVLRAPSTLAWLTGARTHVPNTLDTSCFDVVIEGIASDEPAVIIVSNVIEAPRLAETELVGLQVGYRTVPWTENRELSLPSGERVGADVADDRWRCLAEPITAARRILTDRQADRLSGVCADAATAVTDAALQLTPDQTEYSAAAVLAAELLGRGLDPVCLFVAGGARMGHHRHPLPTGAELADRVTLVCCARRNGLIASVTRIVCFGEPDDLDRYRALLEVERVFLDRSAPGVSLGAVVAAGIDAYRDNGFDADEWTRHHQGGLTGWQPREFPARPDSTTALAGNAVVAWNPSGDAYKVEDTCLVTAGGVRPLAVDPRWPCLEVGGRRRPALLIR